MKLSSNNWRDLKELYLIICYKEDRESKFKTLNYFDNLKQHLVNFKIRDVLIIGDLNGRIGLLNDNTELKLKSRISEDATINPQGREIIDFCNETKLIIMNGGRLEDGKCTYYALQNEMVKKSVIDYLIISESVLKIDLIKKFEICPPVRYTDHPPMTIELNIALKEEKIRTNKINLKQIERNSKNKVYPYKWTEPNSIKFDNEIFKKQCNELNERLAEIHQPYTNTEIFEGMIQIRNNSLKNFRNERPNIIVYSEETRNKRQTYRQCVIRWKEKNTHENLTKMLKAKRDFNKTLKTEQRKIKTKRLLELRKAKEDNDGKKYWQLINKMKIKKFKTKSTLKAEDFKTQI